MMVSADLIIIGAGPGGYELAAEQAHKGKNVVLIERDLPGGTCLNRGCIPTKCLCASASTALTIANASQFGINVAAFTPDYSKAAERMRTVVDGLRDGVSAATAACNCVQGEASFNADGNVVVGDEVYTAPQIIIATGSKPAVLPVPGADLTMSSDEFLALDKLPASVAVIGGGVIGLEFASIMAAFGTEVTVIEYCKEILPPFDKEVAKRLRTMLTRRGVKFIVGAAVTAVAANENGAGRIVTYNGKKGEETVAADAVLMAVGRRPVLPAGLDLCGIEVSQRGFIVTDDKMQTTRQGVYAVGDCNGRLMLAHAATAQGRVALGEDVDLSVIPSAVFTVPEAAMAGLTTEQCEAQGIEFKSAKAMFAGNGKAQAMGEGEGLVKVLYCPNTRKLIGCHIVGPHAADLVAETVIAISQGMTVDQIATHFVHGHPTLSEVVMAACANAK
jgi:dihydrolipoamide dehydrogenase